MKKRLGSAVLGLVLSSLAGSVWAEVPTASTAPQTGAAVGAATGAMTGAMTAASAEPETPTGPVIEWTFAIKGLRSIAELQALKAELKTRLGEDAMVFEKMLLRGTTELVARSSLAVAEIQEQIVSIPLPKDRVFTPSGFGMSGESHRVEGEVKNVSIR